MLKPVSSFGHVIQVFRSFNIFRFSICKQPSPLKKINSVRKNINTVGIKMKYLWLDEAIYVDFRSSLNFVCEENVKFSIPDGIQVFRDV